MTSTRPSRASEETWVVARYEFTTRVRKKAFLVVTFGLPLIGVAIGAVTGNAGLSLGQGMTSAFDLPVSSDTAEPAMTIGLVDPSGFVRREAGVAARFVRFEDPADARDAVRDGSVDVAYILPADYPASLEVVRWSTGLQVRGADQLPFRQLLRANLWPQASDGELADLAVPGRRVDLALDLPRYRLARGNVVAIALPLMLGVILYGTIFTVSSYLLQGLTAEKENRVLEILLTSIKPTSLLVGKLIGLGALGLVQVAVWGVAAGLMSGVGLAVAAREAGLELGPGVAITAGLYFLLGYFFYASLMAGVGALAPSFKESGALTFVVLFPAWTPFFAIEAILAEPNGTAARLFTFLPPTAPLVGVMRVAIGPVPAAEVAASLLLLGLAGCSVLWAASRLFTANILLARGLPSATAVLGSLRGRP